MHAVYNIYVPTSNARDKSYSLRHELIFDMCVIESGFWDLMGLQTLNTVKNQFLGYTFSTLIHGKHV